MYQARDAQTDALFKAILTLRSVDECYDFFEDLLTVKEQQSIVQRFQVALRLDAGENYGNISQASGVSSATICRVNKCLQYGSGYRLALDRLREAGTLPDGND